MINQGLISWKNSCRVVYGRCWYHICSPWSFGKITLPSDVIRVCHTTDFRVTDYSYGTHLDQIEELSPTFLCLIGCEETPISVANDNLDSYSKHRDLVDFGHLFIQKTLWLNLQFSSILRNHYMLGLFELKEKFTYRAKSQLLVFYWFVTHIFNILSEK